MIFRTILGTLIRQKRRSLLVGLTMALGISLATAMLAVVFGVSDQVNRELKAFGANIVVTQKTAALAAGFVGPSGQQQRRVFDESNLGRIKTIFWANNIVDFAPYLEQTVHLPSHTAEQSSLEVPLVGTWFSREISLPTGDTVRTGMRNLRSWWTLTGEWVDEDCCADQGEVPVMAGQSLATQQGWQIGQTVELPGTDERLVIRGIFQSGGEDDGKLFTPLPLVQRLAELPGKVERVEVSTITTPENELARQAARNPRSLSTKEWDTWYCTAYVSAIAYQIEEALPETRAKPVRQVAESEGTILKKTQTLMLLIAIISLLGTSLGIANLVSAGVVERSKELGLLKALGASDGQVAFQITLETAALGFLGGALGYGAGFGLAQMLSWTVFGSGLEVSPAVIVVVALMVALVSLVGCLPAIRGLLTLRPKEVLHGR